MRAGQSASIGSCHSVSGAGGPAAGALWGPGGCRGAGVQGRRRVGWGAVLHCTDLDDVSSLIASVGPSVQRYNDSVKIINLCSQS